MSSPLSPAAPPPARDEPSAGAPVVSNRRAVGVLVTLALMGFLMVTNEILPFGLINLMAADLDRTQSQIGLLVTGYALVIVAVSVPLAMLTKRIPRRQLLTVTMAVWVVGALLAATADDYNALLVGRLLTAFAQAMYWAIVTATVAGLFPPAVRGKVVARLLLGPASAAVFGMPTLTALGQRTDWRMAFFVIAGIGTAVTVAIAVLVPSYKPADGSAAKGSSPNLKRFVALLAITGLSVLGLMTVYTYITPFLIEISGYADTTVPWLLAGSGIIGLIAMWTVGRYLDKFPRGTLAAGLGILLTCWVGMATLGSIKLVGGFLFLVVGIGFNVLVGALMNRVMQLSPGSTDLGVATYSALYNVGISLGSLIGAGILDVGSPELLPVAGAIFMGTALAVLAAVNIPAIRATLSKRRGAPA